MLKNSFLSAIFITAVIILSCSKEKGPGSAPIPPPKTDPASTIQPQVDPALAATIGFFMDDWQERSFTAPASYNTVTAPPSAPYTVTIDRSNVLTKIPRTFAGHNANIWMGDMINESALIDQITTLKPHVIRFPGGSISDKYFWNAPKDQPPADAPAVLVNADGSTSPSGFWYGKNNESWTISVDKYYQMLAMTGSQGLITINYGYARYGTGVDPVAAAAHLAAEWVRYDNGRTKYWEIGNENYGDWEAGYRIKLADNKDGQPEFLTGLLYGQHFKVFADSMKKAAQQMGKTIYIGAVTYESTPASWATNTLKTWNTGLFAGSGSVPDYYVVHNYYTAYHTNATAPEILASPTAVTQAMMSYVKQSIAAAGLPLKPVAMDEYNIFSTGSMQQVSNINGLHAIMVLGEALKNQFGLTARWDLSNAWDNGNDHGLFNAGDEPGGVPKWNPRPAYYYMYYFQRLTGDRLLSSTSTSNDILCYSSSFGSGEVGATIVNRSSSEKTVEIKIDNFNKGNRFYWYVLSGGTDNGDFSRKVSVNGMATTYNSGGPTGYKTIAPYSALVSGGLKVSIPAWSAAFLVVEKK